MLSLTNIKRKMKQNKVNGKLVFEILLIGLLMMLMALVAISI